MHWFQVKLTNRLQNSYFSGTSSSQKTIENLKGFLKLGKNGRPPNYLLWKSWVLGALFAVQHNYYGNRYNIIRNTLHKLPDNRKSFRCQNVPLLIGSIFCKNSLFNTHLKHWGTLLSLLNIQAIQNYSGQKIKQNKINKLITVFREEAIPALAGFMRVLYAAWIGIWRCFFCRGRKTGEPREKSLEQRTKTKLNPHMAPGWNRNWATVGGECSLLPKICQSVVLWLNISQYVVWISLFINFTWNWDHHNYQVPHTMHSHALMKQNIETLVQNYTKFKSYYFT